MAWLLFMDESGHSHKELPYEVRGGYALADTQLWPFVQDVLRLELSCFGARLADYKSEVKGMKLLSKDRFEHAAQMPEIENVKRQHLCRSLLQAGLEKRPPTREQGEWEEHRLAFGDFVPTFRGRVLTEVPPLNPAKVNSVGFLIADKQAGPFRLEIGWIKASPPIKP